MKHGRIVFPLIVALFFVAFCLIPGPAMARQSLKTQGSVQKAAASGNLFERPDTGSKVIGKIKKGEKITVLGRSGGFVKIRSSRGKVGYVLTTVVEGASARVGKKDSNRISDREKKKSAEMKKKKKTVTKEKKDSTKELKKASPGKDHKGSLKKTEPKESAPTRALRDKMKKSQCPTFCVAVKGGLATPFFEVYSGAVEADVWYRLAAFGATGIYAVGAIGYIPLKPNIPMTDRDPQLEGYWVPVHLGVNLAWYGRGFTPYIGLGVGGHYYSAKINPDESRIKLEEKEDDGGRSGSSSEGRSNSPVSSRTGVLDPSRTPPVDVANRVPSDEDDDLHILDNFGFGGRILVGTGIQAGPGSVLLEAQLHGNTVEKDFVATAVFFLGYRYCW